MMAMGTEVTSIEEEHAMILYLSIVPEMKTRQMRVLNEDRCLW
jgi:hypothetical protein